MHNDGTLISMGLSVTSVAESLFSPHEFYRSRFGWPFSARQSSVMDNINTTSPASVASNQAMHRYFIQKSAALYIRANMP